MDQTELGEVLPGAGVGWGLLIKMHRQERKKKALAQKIAEFGRKGAKRK